MYPSSASTRPVPRLVATDLDGTLIGRDGTVSAYTAEVLAELDRRDVPVVFVTGRPLRWAREVFAHVGSHGLAIVTNGALVWDVSGDQPLAEHALEPDVALAVAAALRAEIEGVTFSVETVAGWLAEPGFRRRPGSSVIKEGPLEEILTLPEPVPVLKLLAIKVGADPDEMLAAAEPLVGDVVEVTHSNFPLLEISALGVTKATTLATLCDGLGIAAEEVVAFGDMPNDLPMLRWAGRSYAMADAHPDVLACSTHLAPGHDDDGVARVLAELFDL